MRRLILGIIAVIVLEIAFFSYVATDRGIRTEVRIARTTAPEARIRSIQAAEPSTVSIPAISTQLARNGERRANIAKTRLRPAEKVEAGRNSQPNVRRAGVTSRTFRAPAVERSSVLIETSPARSLIPKGHTMVLVDHMPVASAEKSVGPATKKHKRRSYLERTLPALVKKPWNFIKSVASKLK